MRYEAKDIKALIAEDDDFIINLLADFGSDYRVENNAVVFRTVCHQGSSYKLYYYPESQNFHCYTDCSETFDVITLVMKVKGCGFVEALNFLGERLGLDMDIRHGIGIGSRGTPKEETPAEPAKPFDITEFKRPEIQYYDAENLLRYFQDVYYTGWLDEGISEEAMAAFEIKFYYLESQIVIPCRDYNGKLAGFRVRELNEDARAKYHPLYCSGEMYNFETSLILYGLYQNMEAIKKSKKCILFEGEKSVLKARTFYGSNTSCAAVFGHYVSRHQLKLLYDLGVEEVILAFDYDATGNEFFTFETNRRQVEACSMKCSIMLDGYKEMLDTKDSPIDKGKEVFDTLLGKRSSSLGYKVFTDTDDLEGEMKVFLQENNARAIQINPGHDGRNTKEGYTTLIYVKE